MYDQAYQQITQYYEEIEIQDFVYDNVLKCFKYPCPCGDEFIISLEDLENDEEIATCPSCSLFVKVIFEKEDLAQYL
ncbi:hypothetical protein EDEG_00783 [Edhazardia aedis USNM 41457]|uniref:Diphthamide biosynthesis protein 3 n=1 Tax=Edhazardia aedis (strain USNM 41457) TaxID=1003232 RepID=J8ZZQ5_EDHAE|nr:hypothetical protein EDEG_00783 [Edhazardia aedis USNM 41457]|eukprot:EJW05113.1 hypothetical protein EDEG_00783 [Edhazardia aedis USNM 41457]